MRTAILAASAIALALSAGPVLAAKTHAKAATAAEPKQPVPYAELNAYLKATPKQRATRDWWSGQATTGSTANTAATSTAGADMSATTSPASSSASSTTTNPAPSEGATTSTSTPPTDTSPTPPPK